MPNHFVDLFDVRVPGPLVLAGEAEAPAWGGCTDPDRPGDDYSLCPSGEHEEVKLIRKPDGSEFLSIADQGGPASVLVEGGIVWIFMWRSSHDPGRPVVPAHLRYYIEAEPEASKLSPAICSFTPHSSPLLLWHAAWPGTDDDRDLVRVPLDRPGSRYQVTAAFKRVPEVGRGMLVQLTPE